MSIVGDAEDTFIEEARRFNLDTGISAELQFSDDILDSIIREEQVDVAFLSKSDLDFVVARGTLIELGSYLDLERVVFSVGESLMELGGVDGVITAFRSG